MEFEDVIVLQQKQKDIDIPFPITKRRKIRNYYSVNDLVAIPIEYCSSYYDRGIDLPILKKDRTEIGYLFFTKGLNVINIHTLSEPKFICYLKDIANVNIIEDSLEHTFNTDYLIIYRNYLIEYLESFLNTAPLWGFFNHKYPSLVNNPPIKKTIAEITVDTYSKFSKDYYYEASVRGLKHSLAFDRFLKYYHLLELNFDFDVIERIKKLDTVAESKLIGVLLNEYKKDDIERLKYLFHSYCLDINPIIERMKLPQQYLSIAQEIFYTFGKDSNPLKLFSKFKAINLKADGFTINNCKTEKVQNVSNTEDHAKFIGNLCVYWIYRIRNSIAHNKVGEYLMTNRDEEFIVDFAEPLLLEFLKQVFK